MNPKKIILCPNPNRDQGMKTTRAAEAILRGMGFQTVVCSPFRDRKEGAFADYDVLPLPQELRGADLLITFGGDGTILHLAKLAALHKMPVLGVNMGGLGFVAELEATELEQLHKLKDWQFEMEQRMMLDVSVLRDGRQIYTNLGLNDAVIREGPISHVIHLKLSSDGRHLADIAGDGVIVATPTGSTAYSLFASIVPVPAVPIVEDMLTGCLLGGVISGTGVGLTLTSGCCGGGVDLLGLYLAKRGAKMTVGRFNLFFNAALFVACWALYDLPTLIYSVLNTIFNAVSMDRAHRQSVTVQVLIFTKKDTQELGRYILENLHRGITRWEGRGVYTGEATHILCVCMNKYEIDDLREALHSIDPKAFFIVQEGVHVSTNFERRLS